MNTPKLNNIDNLVYKIEERNNPDLRKWIEMYVFSETKDEQNKISKKLENIDFYHIRHLV